MSVFVKKSLAVFSLTCCEGCQFELLKDYDSFNKMLNFYDLKNFRLGQEDNYPGPFDVAIIEGTPESQREYKILHAVRRQSTVVIAMGACAIMGGIQSQRNRMPQNLFKTANVKPINQFIKVDYNLYGCPINNKEAISTLIDIYWQKIPKITEHSVCFECRLNENECLIKKGLPCLGPITRGGCNSVCINGGEACLGCRGPVPQANFYKMKEILKDKLDKNEIENWLTLFGDYQKELDSLTNKKI